MDTTTSSLFWIVLCSVLAPILAGLVPGMAIDPAAVAARPGVLAVFVALILVVRGCLVLASERAHGRRTSLRCGRPPSSRSDVTTERIRARREWRDHRADLPSGRDAPARASRAAGGEGGSPSLSASPAPPEGTHP